jgi:hypothetical protein
MTINEFRAWLDGFKEAIGEAPTAEQWAKVLEKLETVHQLTTISTPNLPGYPQWVPTTPVWCGPNTATTSAKPFISSTSIIAGEVTLAKLDTFGVPGERETLYEN